MEKDMGRNSNIAWTGDTWNPFYAINKATGKRGWHCVFHGPGCLQCYAHHLNMSPRGTGLPFHADSLKEVDLRISTTGESSIDWPLRLQKAHTIFLGSMTDWMAPFYPQNWQSLVLGVMALATRHTFITLTKRWSNLFAMLQEIEKMPNRTIMLPADKAFVKGILRANQYKGVYNLSKSLRVIADPELAKERPVHTLSPWQESAEVPWLPRNVFFGISVCTADEAKRAAPLLNYVRGYFPEIRLVISQEPALEIIDWKKAGLLNNAVDWIIWGGESGDNARPAYKEDWFNLRDFGDESGTKVFFKQTGNVLARQLGLEAVKGDDINEATLIDSLEPIQEAVDMMGALV